MARVILEEEHAHESREGIFVTTVLKMEAKHYNGKYNFYVNKQEESRDEKLGVTMVEYRPFDSCNFSATIGTGRKSDKKLTTLNNIIEENKDKLLELWKENNHEEMFLTVFKAQYPILKLVR